MGFWEIVVEAVKTLMPPRADDQNAQQRWRWVVFSAIVGLSASFSLHVAIANGYFPSISSGYALVADQMKIQRRVDVIAALSLEHEIRAKTAELCVERSPQRRYELNDDISKLQREYREVQGYWYNVPNCDKL